MKFRLSETFRASFQQLSVATRKKVEKAIKLFENDSRHPSLQVRKLSGVDNVWYLRVDQRHRLTFHFDSEGYCCLRNVGPHDDTLNNP